jgi:hypothetical protein
VVRQESGFVEGLREALRIADGTNSRDLAGTIGGRIAQLTWLTQNDASVRLAIDRFRDASVQLFEALARRKAFHESRGTAFDSLDALELQLARWRVTRAVSKD